jgi:hypothetical protein
MFDRQKPKSSKTSDLLNRCVLNGADTGAEEITDWVPPHGEALGRKDQSLRCRPRIHNKSPHQASRSRLQGRNWAEPALLPRRPMGWRSYQRCGAGCGLRPKQAHRTRFKEVVGRALDGLAGLAWLLCALDRMRCKQNKNCHLTFASFCVLWCVEVNNVLLSSFNSLSCNLCTRMQ